MTSLVREHLNGTAATIQKVLADEAILSTVAAAAEATAASMLKGGKLLVAGNGGSAADAQHLVAEFVCRLVHDRDAMPAIALTVDSSNLTAIGNDLGFDRIFSRQVAALGANGDVFFGISTSGNSPNILSAIDEAKRRGMLTIGFTGKDGGRMTGLCDFTITIPSSITAHIQECHLALEHVFCAMTERCYFEVLKQN
ncbi:MAG: SIS domain-containing protein [Acidobacteria bacterium]|nr:SIS domain-containing protein [Acidobacteriota bacterium]